MKPNKTYFIDYEAKQTYFTEYASALVRGKKVSQLLLQHFKINVCFPWQ